MASMNDYAQYMEAVALALLGEPNRTLSARTKWRYGRKGSMAVDLDTGEWFDHEADAGGGVLDLIAFCNGYGTPGYRDRKRAAEWFAARFGNNDHRPRAKTQQQRWERERLRAKREADQRGQDEVDRRAARRIWDETAAISSTLAEFYLRRWRGIAIPLPPSLRFHPACWCSEARDRLPALVAGWQDVNGAFAAIHRIYLDPETGNKARLTQPKKSLAPTKCTAIRLGAAGERLALAEGPESGLAIQELSGWPVWVCNFSNVELPTTVREVAIAGDNDANGAGQHKARRGAERLTRRGLMVHTVLPDAMPDRRNTDWDDVLCAMKAEGQP